MPKVRVRKTKDFDRIKELDAECIGADAAGTLRRDHVWWILYVDGEVAGYAGLGIYRSEGGYAFLSRAGVLPKFRGKGLQRKLVRIREAEALRQGVTHVLTYTSRYNMQSANNLIRCGYRLYMPHERWGVEGAYYFYKDLAKRLR